MNELTIKNDLRNHKQINRLQENILSIKHYTNVTIIPYQGCFDNDKQFIDGTWLHEITSFQYKEPIDTLNIKKAVYIGCFVNIWGHCITDGLKRLWYFYSKEFKIQDDVEFVFIKVNPLPLPENFYKILKYILPEKIKIKEIESPALIDELIIPDVSFYSSLNEGKLFYKEYLFILNLLKQKYNKPLKTESYDKIYLSRTNLKTHIEYGEKYIEKIFDNAGFKIIHPENYSLEEQLFLYENCNYFASLEGSGAHNSVFCKPETYVIILRKSNFINGYQIAIDKMNNTKTSYIDCNCSIMNSKKKPWAGPYFLYISKQLSSYMNQTFSLHIKSHFPFFLFVKYFFSSLLYNAINFLRFLYHKLFRK
ncbi:MAG: glycosyltransferase family 61 protein [Treponema sp.]|nr:glycosyltransferase family 61 protein [Treponema sp.]